MSEHIHVSIEDRIAILTINRPPVNALDTATLNELDDTLDRLLADQQVKAIILTGAGSYFVAGADIQELHRLNTYHDAYTFIRTGQMLLNKIEQSPKPIIAAINGKCALGGGHELALACHLRIAEEGALLGQPEIKLGLMPGWGATQRLPRLIGRGRALELCLMGDPIDAQEAYRIGLVNRVVPPGQALQAAKQMAQTLIAYSVNALAAILGAFSSTLDETFSEGLVYEAHHFSLLCETEDKQEGTTAFLEKRQPHFRDR